MTKLAVLIDPGKDEKTEQVFRSVVEILKEVKRYSPYVEIWVGDTGDFSGQGVRKYIVKLREEEVRVPIVIFPGNPFQVSAGADAILVPDIVNLHSWLIQILMRLGKIYLSFRGLLTRKEFPRKRHYGYIVLDASTKIGRRLKAKTLSDTEVLDYYQRYKRKYWEYFYIEAGSGAHRSVATRIPLVKRIQMHIHDDNKALIVGGGIRTAEEIGQLVEAGTDIVVVSTVLEESQHPKEFLRDFLESIVTRS